MCARGRRTKDAERRGRMPAFGVVIEVNPERNLGFGFEAGDIRGDKVAAARADFIRECKQRGQYRRRRMAAERIIAIVKIQRMRGGAVDYGSIERIDSPLPAEHIARPCAAAERAPRQTRSLFMTASERDADGVENADLCPANRGWRQRVVSGCGDALC